MRETNHARREWHQLLLLIGLTCLLAPSTSFAQALVQQGKQLFNSETFNGNGRTCQTCHLAGQAFGLTPDGIAGRFAQAPLDPLFIAENDPALSNLENSCLMRQGNNRGLILENIDGFANNPVFRGSPHLLNVNQTAPYGLSGEFADLRVFSTGAVMQHFTQTLGRNAGVDFRLPTSGELDAMEAFMNSLVFPIDGNLDLDRMINFHVAENGADAAAIARGRALFFGSQAQCSTCHNGPALADADGTLGSGSGNENFNTGTVNQAVNLNDGCSGGPGDPVAALPPEDSGNREFNTPPLVGVALTAPFFHDNSVSTLFEAVRFYAAPEFATSPAAALLPAPIILPLADVLDIVAFLEAISVDPTPPVPVPVPVLSPVGTLVAAASVLIVGMMLQRARRRKVVPEN